MTTTKRANIKKTSFFLGKIDIFTENGKMTTSQQSTTSIKKTDKKQICFWMYFWPIFAPKNHPNSYQNRPKMDPNREVQSKKAKRRPGKRPREAKKAKKSEGGQRTLGSWAKKGEGSQVFGRVRRHAGRLREGEGDRQAFPMQEASLKVQHASICKAECGGFKRFAHSAGPACFGMSGWGLMDYWITGLLD